MKAIAPWLWLLGLISAPLDPLTSANAQIIPDSTLPINSSVTPGCTVCTIDGGTTRNNHLFHSFREFSIPTGGVAWFNNSPQIQTILTRVTGRSLSDIDGLIRANGTANLFLLNPNGIVFGANARLQIGGSFVASTASSFQFPDGSEFSATNPQVPPLLTVNLTPGLQYGKPVGDLQQAGNLTVPAGQSLTLVGNTVIHTGTLTAAGGTVQVLGDRVALLAPTVIDVSSPTGGGTVRIGGNFKGQGTLPTATATYVGVGTMINADATAPSANGGEIVLWANNSLKAYGTLSAQAISGNGGLVETSSANVLDVGGIQVNAAAGNGKGGTWLIDPRNVLIQNSPTTTGSFSGTNPDLFTPTGNDTIISTADIEARLNAGTNVIITTGTTGTQDGNITVLDSITKTVFTPPANLTLEAANDIIVAPGVAISALFVPSSFGPLNVTLTADSDRSGSGNVNIFGRIFTNAGSVNISGQSVLLDQAQVESGSTSFLDNGASSGAISITANTLTLQNSSRINASDYGTQTSPGIDIQLSSSLSLVGNSSITSDERGAGTSAPITITLRNPDSIARLDSSEIETVTYGQGNAGAVSVSAGSIVLSGSPARRSFIQSGSSGNGAAGAVAVTATTGSVIANYSGVLSGSRGRGDAGAIAITAADTVAFSNGNIDSRSLGTEGGSLQMSARRIVLDDTFVRTSGFGREDSGTILFRGSESIDLLNASRVSTTTFGSGNAGAIRLETARLRVDNSTVTSETYNAGNAGAITVLADAAAIANNSNIRSTVSQGIGTPPTTGNGQIISINTRILAITDSNVSAATFSVGNAGGIVLQTENLFATNSTISTAVDEGALGQGGKVEVQTRDLTLVSGAQISASTAGTGRAGDVDVRATGTVNITGENTGIFASSSYTIFLTGTGVAVPNRVLQASGDGGNITVRANTLIVQNNAQLAASTTGQGNAGSIQVTANSFVANTGGQLLTTTSGSGRAGDITVNANNQVQLTNFGTGLFANTSNGPGGTITVNTSQFQLGDGATLNATTSAGNAGGNITISGYQFTATTGGQILTTTTGTGKAGDITVNFRDRVFLADPGTGLFANTNGGLGGAIAVNAPTVQVTNGAVLNAATGGISPGGNMSVNAQSFEAASGGQLLTTTSGNGQAGDITVNSRDLILLSGSGTGLFANTTAGSSGNGGNITANAQTIAIRDSAQLAVDSQGNGQGGSVRVQANTLTLDRRGVISAETTSNQGGNITLQVSDLLLLRRNSLISTTAGTAQAGGDGGNIQITAPFIIGVLAENSDITANAFSGRGGNVTITANAIYGLQLQPRLTPFSDITASSQLGISGTITLNTLNIDPNRGLAALPGNFVDSSNQIAATCAPGGKLGRRGNEFVITGRGGLPIPPEESFSGSDRPLVTLTELVGEAEGGSGENVRLLIGTSRLEKSGGRRQDLEATRDESGYRVGSPATPSLHHSIPHLPSPISPPPPILSPLMEAQSWAIAPDGTIYLLSNTSTTMPYSNWQPSVNCPNF